MLRELEEVHLEVVLGHRGDAADPPVIAGVDLGLEVDQDLEAILDIDPGHQNDFGLDLHDTVVVDPDHNS